MNTNVIFTNIQKEKLDLLKDNEALKADFKFSTEYQDFDKKITDKNEVYIEGFLYLSVDKEESKEFLKDWKRNEVPKDKVIPLYNFILKKCSIKALGIEEDLNLQPHIPMPQLKPGKD